MTTRIELRYAGPQDKALCMGLIDTLWRKGHRLSWDEPLFEWMFGARAHLWDKPGYSFAIACNGDEPVGIHGGIPFRLNVHGDERLGVWRMFWIVVPDARAGNAGMLLHRAMDRPPYVSVSFGINDVVARLYKAMGWSMIPDIPRHVTILPNGVEAARRLLRRAYPDWAPARVDALIDAFRSLPLAPADGMELGIPTDWDGAGWGRIAPNVIGASRDADYLAWRYRDHPGFDYRLVGVRKNGVPALAVWRAETISADGAPLCRMGRVVEFLLPEPSAAPHLLAALLADMTAQGMDAADYYGYHYDTGRALDGLGFRATHAIEDGPAIPTRFQPLEGGGGRIHSGLRANGLPVPTFPAEPGGQWLWTKGDSDQDRPN